jgi:hypothetical protein
VAYLLLRDGVSEKEFLPRLHAFFQHFIDMGFATGYRVMRREALDDFGKTLPAFAYRRLNPSDNKHHF